MDLCWESPNSWKGPQNHNENGDPGSPFSWGPQNFMTERYLGGAVGTSSFVRQYVKRKVECWVNEVEKLSKFAETQPHAAYAAFTHGLSSKWNYLLRVTDWEENQFDDILETLEKAIQSHFIPALTGQPPPGNIHGRC